MESNRARGTFQQLRLATQRRLTWRLYSLYYRIETLKSRLEVCWTSLLEYAQLIMAAQLATDEQQLILAEGATSVAVPGPVAGTHLSYYKFHIFTSHRFLWSASPVNIIIDQALLPPATQAVP